MEISRERAEKFLTILVSEGLNADYFTTKGVGSKRPLREEATDWDRELNRCVTFSVTMMENQK
jgi:OOP family OmpA-OmpF porin